MSTAREYITSIVGGEENLDSLTSVRNLYQVVIVLGLLALIGFPLLFYIWGSFWTTSPGLGGQFTLEGYRKLLDPSVYETFGNTLLIATMGSLLAVGLGVLTGLLTTKTDIPGKRFISLVVIIQYLLPGFVIALGWEFYAQGTYSLLNVALRAVGIDGAPISVQNVIGIALVTGIHYSGLVFLLTVSSIEAVPASLEEAATMSGAGKLTIIRQIVLKLALPSIVIAFVLVFSRLMQSFGIPLILGLPKRVFVLATRMYIALRAGFPPDFAFASAIGMLILTVTVVGLIAQRRIAGANEKYEVIGGKGSSLGGTTMSLGRFRYPAGILVALAIVVLFIMPIIVIIISSLQEVFIGFRAGRIGVTFKHYEALFFGLQSNDFYASLVNTVVIGLLGAFFGMVIASFASYIVIKADSPLGAAVDFLTLTPAAMPGIIVATAFMWIFLTYNFLGLYNTIWIIMLALTARFIVYGTRATNSAFRSVSTDLEEAAQVNGASFLTILREVYLPLIKPGFLAGFTILAIDYMKVLTIPLLLSGGQQNKVLAVLLWEIKANGDPEAAAAVAVVMLVLIGGGYLVVNFFTDVDVQRL